MVRYISKLWSKVVDLLKGKKEAIEPSGYPYTFPLTFDGDTSIHQLCCSPSFSWGRILNGRRGKEYIELLPNQSSEFNADLPSASLAPLKQDDVARQPLLTVPSIKWPLYVGGKPMIRLYGDLKRKVLTSSNVVNLRNNSFIAQFAFKFYSLGSTERNYLMWVNYKTLFAGLRIDNTNKLYAFIWNDNQACEIVRSEPLVSGRSYIITWYYDIDRNEHGLLVNSGCLARNTATSSYVPTQVDIMYGNGPNAVDASLNAEYGALFFQTEEVPVRSEFEKVITILSDQYLNR